MAKAVLFSTTQKFNLKDPDLDYKTDSQNRHIAIVSIFDSKNSVREFKSRPNIRKKQGEFEACCKAILFLKNFIQDSVYQIQYKSIISQFSQYYFNGELPKYSTYSIVEEKSIFSTKIEFLGLTFVSDPFPKKALSENHALEKLFEYLTTRIDNIENVKVDNNNKNKNQSSDVNVPYMPPPYMPNPSQILDPRLQPSNYNPYFQNNFPLIDPTKQPPYHPHHINQFPDYYDTGQSYHSGTTGSSQSDFSQASDFSDGSKISYEPINYYTPNGNAIEYINNNNNIKSNEPSFNQYQSSTNISNSNILLGKQELKNYLEKLRIKEKIQFDSTNKGEGWISRAQVGFVEFAYSSPHKTKKHSENEAALIALNQIKQDPQRFISDYQRSS